MLAFGVEDTIPIEVSFPTLKRLEPNSKDKQLNILTYLKKYENRLH